MINISFVGGDKRNRIIADLFEKDGFSVYTYGLDKNSKISMEECINASKYIVTSIPFSHDSVFINAPYSNDKLEIDKFLKLLSKKIVIGGKFSQNQISMLKANNNEVFDVIIQEELQQKNAIPTVEGMVKTIIENTDYTINESNIAIIGFGRIGKRASKILNAMGANIFCVDTNKVEVANIRLCGYNVIENICSENQYNIIINTVPKMVIGEKEFSYINKDTLIIDISSKPGGIDFKYAKDHGYNVIHELGIPGKVAPHTAAIYVKEIIEKLIL